MALKDLLYRCPHCGQDPVEGRRDRVRCPSCDALFVRNGRAGYLRMEVDGEVADVAVPRLVASIARRGGPFPAATDAQGRVRYEAEVIAKRAVGEEPIRRGGALVGFTERLGEGREGILRLEEGALSLLHDGVVASCWNLMDLRAVQASSSSLQIRAATGELVHFRFVADSPRRWEDLLQGTLRTLYRDAGRGEIVEFQPRIDTE